jgi:pantoate--beta-alanine ligase
MEAVRSVREIREIRENWRQKKEIVALVPTMGYFHEGHLELMRQAKKKGHRVVVSLFDNPTQFGPGEDLERYPRNEKRDIELAQKVGVDLLFVPSPQEMYPKGYNTYVEVGPELTAILCGAARPTHFRGVTTVVAKLFNIIEPDYAFFGQKDFQQAVVVKRMASDLNFPLEIITVPTVREEDGLAKSSRNAYLTEEERKIAPFLFRALKEGEKAILEEGLRDIEAVRERMIKVLQPEKKINLEYLEIRRSEDLAPLAKIEGVVGIALAARIGKTRLIDNMVVEVP